MPEMERFFRYDERLGIQLPALEEEWEAYPEETRAGILLRWEQIRGYIPSRIFELEAIIIRKQHLLDHEDDFPTSCRLNSEIADLASAINDLHLWFRTNQDLETKMHQ